MRVVVIPDVHLKPWLFDKAERILRLGKADRAVCLMDIPDDWNMSLRIDKYKETYDRAIAFAKDFPDTLWCYGNHDVSYRFGRLESGYSPYAESTVLNKLEELEQSLKDPEQIAFIHRIDNVLFMHGGLTTDYVEWTSLDLIDADIDDIIDSINRGSVYELWNDRSPLWFRPQMTTKEMFRTDEYTQVVGHTPVENIYEENGVISTDTFSTHSDGRQIGESAMVVIDTVGREYKEERV